MTTTRSYEDMRAEHEWRVPDRYNIAQDVCDKHPRDKLAMIWEDWQGNERRVEWGELQDLSNKFANVLEANGVERGDRVATLLPLAATVTARMGPALRGGTVYTDDKAPVEWLTDLSILSYATGRR